MPGGKGLGVLISEDAGASWKSYESAPQGESILASYGPSANINNLYVSVMSDKGAKKLLLKRYG